MSENCCLFTMCDDKYALPCAVMLYSFFETNPTYNGSIIVFYDDVLISLSDESKQMINKVSDKIQFVKVDYKQYEAGIENCKKFCSKGLLCSYYKFEMFKYIDKFTKFLWLDSDMVFNDSINEFFKIQTNGIYLTRDIIAKNVSYFNTGFLFFVKDSLLLKNPFYVLIKIIESCDIDFFKNSICRAKGLYGDQDILNQILPLFFKHIYDVSMTYNLNQIAEEETIFKRAKIIHYCGYPKPFFEKEYGLRKNHYIWKEWCDKFMKYLEEKKALE